MNKRNALKLLISWMLVAVAQIATAQDEWLPERGRIENVTNYHSFSGNQAIRKIGSIIGAPIPTLGAPHLPIILVQFDDLKFTARDTEEALVLLYDSLMNAGTGIQPGTSAISVGEYFNEQSSGLFTPQFTVIGPVTLSRSYAYYGENKDGAKDVNIREFYKEACQLAAQQNIDWTTFDNNHDGRVDFLYFIYAGEPENVSSTKDPNTIWPKESTSAMTVTYEDNGEKSITIGAYGCSNELLRGNLDGIGTIVHELCHGLGLPDLYDTKGNGFGLDYWDIMDSGCYQAMGMMPCCMSGYELDFMGWRKLEELTPDEPLTLTLQPLAKGGKAYKIVNKANPNEYFILENRQNIGCDKYLGWRSIGLYNTYGANHGLMISHVDFNQSAWSTNQVNSDANHPRLTLVPADGELISSSTVKTTEERDVWALSLRGDLYPGEKNVTEMSSYAVYTGGILDQTITNIVEHEDGTITLDINGGKHDEPVIDPNEPIVDPDPDDPDTPIEPEISDSEPEIPEIA
ncbi:MAG: M6 family metalloprotease domain-containing protein [Bacteroidales bacterium]|nr:M6 family metalloprotease domain-containing protein [Bacteroidales bacterium]